MSVETKVKLPAVAAFICANCARAGRSPAERRKAPVLPSLPWSVSVKEVLVPCAGRVQPEHILKAFEAGADVVCVLGCKHGNCHYAEGSLRCQRRIEYAAQLLDDLGLNGQRVMMFYLPGSAREDMAAASGEPALACLKDRVPADQLQMMLSDVAREVAQRADQIGLSPLHMDLPWREPTDAAYEMEENDVAED